MARDPDVESMVYREMLGVEKPEEISACERLLNEFEAHEAGEGEFVKRYKEIAEKSKNSAVKFLLQLIITDEEKHNVVTHCHGLNP
jgi:rubrerythrin